MDSTIFFGVIIACICLLVLTFVALVMYERNYNAVSKGTPDSRVVAARVHPEMGHINGDKRNSGGDGGGDGNRAAYGYAWYGR